MHCTKHCANIPQEIQFCPYGFYCLVTQFRPVPVEASNHFHLSRLIIDHSSFSHIQMKSSSLAHDGPVLYKNPKPILGYWYLWHMIFWSLQPSATFTSSFKLHSMDSLYIYLNSTSSHSTWIFKHVLTSAHQNESLTHRLTLMGHINHTLKIFTINHTDS